MQQLCNREAKGMYALHIMCIMQHYVMHLGYVTEDYAYVVFAYVYLTQCIRYVLLL